MRGQAVVALVGYAVTTAMLALLTIQLAFAQGSAKAEVCLSAAGDFANFCARFVPDLACAEDQ